MSSCEDWLILDTQGCLKVSIIFIDRHCEVIQIYLIYRNTVGTKSQITPTVTQLNRELITNVLLSEYSYNPNDVSRSVWHHLVRYLTSYLVNISFACCAYYKCKA